MMTNDERLSFFHELICCNYRVYLWSYSPDLTLLGTTCPPGNSSCEPVLLPDYAAALLDYIDKGGNMPLILDTLPWLLYVAAFEFCGPKLARIHILGPAFTGRNSHMLLKKDLDQRDYSVRLPALPTARADSDHTDNPASAVYGHVSLQRHRRTDYCERH